MDDQKDNPLQAISRRLTGAIFLNDLITIAEIIGGIVSGSLALISDALHNFSDVVALVISRIAFQLARQPRTPRYTFGRKHAEILAVTLNAAFLVVLCVFLVKEAITRLDRAVLPSGTIMVVIGAIGLLANAAGTLLLRPHLHRNHNL